MFGSICGKTRAYQAVQTQKEKDLGGTPLSGDTGFFLEIETNGGILTKSAMFKFFTSKMFPCITWAIKN